MNALRFPALSVRYGTCILTPRVPTVVRSTEVWSGVPRSKSSTVWRPLERIQILSPNKNSDRKPKFLEPIPFAFSSTFPLSSGTDPVPNVTNSRRHPFRSIGVPFPVTSRLDSPNLTSRRLPPASYSFWTNSRRTAEGPCPRTNSNNTLSPKRCRKPEGSISGGCQSEDVLDRLLREVSFICKPHQSEKRSRSFAQRHRRCIRIHGSISECYSTGRRCESLFLRLSPERPFVMAELATM